MGSALGFLLLRTYDSRPRVWIERLESRRLFSVATGDDQAVMLDQNNQPVATAEVVDGVLTVVTGSGVDDIMIGTARNNPESIYVFVNYVWKYFARSGITAVSVDMGDGDDTLAVYNFGGLVNLPMTLNGGAGDDWFGGEDERDYLDHWIQDRGDGPFAPVHLIGGDGNDTLVGEMGDTIADGGAGTNVMHGREGLFTILEAPVKEPTSVDGGSEEILTTGVEGAQPELDGVGAIDGGVRSAPEAAGSEENSVLTFEEGSLLKRREEELWS